MLESSGNFCFRELPLLSGKVCYSNEKIEDLVGVGNSLEPYTAYDHITVPYEYKT